MLHMEYASTCEVAPAQQTAVRPTELEWDFVTLHQDLSQLRLFKNLLLVNSWNQTSPQLRVRPSLWHSHILTSRLQNYDRWIFRHVNTGNCHPVSWCINSNACWDNWHVSWATTWSYSTSTWCCRLTPPASHCWAPPRPCNFFFFFLQCRIAQDSCGHVSARTKSKRSQQLLSWETEASGVATLIWLFLDASRATVLVRSGRLQNCYSFEWIVLSSWIDPAWLCGLWPTSQPNNTARR